MNITARDRKFLKGVGVTIDQVAQAYEAAGSDTIADAILKDAQCGVSFEAFLDVCNQRDRYAAQVGWLGTVNRELGDELKTLNANCSSITADLAQRDRREARMSHQRAWLFALLLISWAFNLRALMEWAASFRLL